MALPSLRSYGWKFLRNSSTFFVTVAGDWTPVGNTNALSIVGSLWAVAQTEL